MCRLEEEQTATYIVDTDALRCLKKCSQLVTVLHLLTMSGLPVVPKPLVQPRPPLEFLSSEPHRSPPTSSFLHLLHRGWAVASSTLCSLYQENGLETSMCRIYVDRRRCLRFEAVPEEETMASEDVKGLRGFFARERLDQLRSTAGELGCNPHAVRLLFTIENQKAMNRMSRAKQGKEVDLTREPVEGGTANPPCRN
ncbi:unnamed protein product [Darwinula stevensoni]|uniref:Uncharacterized protein n=1 Tax=Darwinula stevensoni TaxID=69355 RepID=A0A7R9A597_9CRUS|nr:unnamed protein product [Darwinula stevensoni]CAG0895171.1 unnamed protein product [Darwinula stevensoni]